MKPKTQILFFTCGDSNDLSTWSNVPFLFAKALEEKRYILHRIDISPNKYLNRLFNTTSFIICKKILKLRACPEFHRTWLHRFITYRRIKKATFLHPNIAFNLFLSFAFYNKYSNKPNVLWCDWTDRIVIERLGRKPTFFEKKSLQHEEQVIKKADLVYTMFPVCKTQMQKMYNREIIYLNRNIVNTVYNGSFNIEENIDTRLNSKKILFIGNIRYKGAAEELINAFNILRKTDTDLTLHIIGMTKTDLSRIGDNIYCYGYLRKDIEKEKNLYYNLLHTCKVLVNPAKQWGGYSSTIEAMYYGTPIIVAPYDDFVENFGQKIDFGHYYQDKPLITYISAIIYSDEVSYKSLCINAHNRVYDYTWNNYTDSFIESLKNNNINV